MQLIATIIRYFNLKSNTETFSTGVNKTRKNEKHYDFILINTFIDMILKIPTIVFLCLEYLQYKVTTLYHL